MWERGAGVYVTNGSLLRIEGFISDITDQVKAQRAVHEAERNLRVLIDAVPESLFLMELAGSVVIGNRKGANRLGVTPNMLEGQNIYELVADDVASYRKQYADLVIRAHNPVFFVDERAGRQIENYIFPVLDADRLLHAIVPEQVTLSYALADQLPAVTADPEQLQQVLINLVENAAESIESGHGQSKITTAFRESSTESTGRE